jgi:hypothetical protein
MRQLTEKPNKRQAKKNQAKADAKAKAVVDAKNKADQDQKDAEVNAKAKARDAKEKLKPGTLGDLSNEFPEKEPISNTPEQNDTWWKDIDLKKSKKEEPKMSRLERKRTDGKGYKDEPKVDNSETPESGEEENIPDHGKGDNKKRSSGRPKDREVNSDTKEIRDKLDNEIHPLVDDMIVQMSRELRNKGNAHNKQYSRRDIHNYYDKIKKEYHATKKQFEDLKGSVKKYNSFWRGGGEKAADKIKKSFPFLWTDESVKQSKDRLAKQDSVDSDPLKVAEDSMTRAHNEYVIAGAIVKALQGGSKGISQSTVNDVADLTSEMFTTVFNYFKKYTPTMVEFSLEHDDEEPITEGTIRSDISKMWVVKYPTKNCKPEDIMSHSSFSNMYDMYGEGVTSDDIYGVYFDKTKAENIAKRLINKRNKVKTVELSEAVIEEARKKVKKRKPKKKKTKKKKRSPRRMKSSFNNAMARFYYTPTMSSDGEGSASGGGDGGGGGE